MKLSEHFLVLLFAVMIFLVFGNVVLRYAFNSGLVSSEELSRFLFMWLTLFGALIIMRENAHLGMSMVVKRLGVRGQRVCRFLSDSIALVCCCLLAHGTWSLVIIAMVEHSPVTGISMGIVYSSLLICSVGMSLMLAHSLYRQVSGKMSDAELVPQESSLGE
ncbi:MAG: TRAP transporter small permease [Burkholderiaceae bacterium]